MNMKMNLTTVSSRRRRRVIHDVPQVRTRTCTTSITSCFGPYHQRFRTVRRLCLLFILSFALWSPLGRQIDMPITQRAMASSDIELLDGSQSENNSKNLLGGVAAAAAPPVLSPFPESLIKQGLTIEFAGMSKDEIESLYSVDDRDPPTPEDLAEDPLFEHYLREKIEEIWDSTHLEEERSKATINGRNERMGLREKQTNEHSSSRDVRSKSEGVKPFSGLRRLEEARCPKDGGMCDLVFEHYTELI